MNHPSLSSAPSSALDLRGVTLELGKRTILNNISLSIEPGEFIGVFGPNGAGKTTLLRALLGLVQPRSGTLHVLGQKVMRGNPAIGYLPQTRNIPSQLTHLSGRDFIASSINGHQWGLRWLGKKEQHAIDRALALVDATALAHRPLAEMSGGERQRLWFAQCLLDKPQLLLLDEPLISLDPHHQKSIIELAQRLHQELKMTVLFCAHELNPLIEALDRVLYLGRGQAALGSVEEVICTPVLSQLYGSTIDVLRVNGRIFVMSGNAQIETEVCHDA